MKEKQISKLFTNEQLKRIQIPQIATEQEEKQQIQEHIFSLQKQIQQKENELQELNEYLTIEYAKLRGDDPYSE